MKFIINYSYRKSVKTFEVVSIDYPAAIKLFWDMVGRTEIWEKSALPIDIININ